MAFGNVFRARGLPRFMPGRCSNAYAYLLSFPEAARAHGGVVAIEGDELFGDAFEWLDRQGATAEAKGS